MMHYRPFSLVLFISSLVVLCVSVLGTNPSGNRVLVLLDNLSLQQTHSSFFKDLQDRGYVVSFFQAEDSSITLTEYGEYLYDHLIIFAPTVEEFGGLIDVPSILDFIDEGHNVLIAADSSVSDPIREIAEECGVEFDEEGSFVLDHFHTQSTNYDLRTVSIEASADTLLNVATITGSKKISDRRPVLFKGIGLAINEVSGLNVGVLRGYDTTYSANPDTPVAEDQVKAIGKDTVLISALQARNNARVVISGSLLFFSDRFATSASDNQYLASEISKWTFKERGLLRATNITHHRAGESEPPSIYTIKDEIVYSVRIEEYNGNTWVPFQSNNVQLEFSMLDPYLRIPLKADKTGLFTTTFTAPDVYGVFSFKVDYHELGYTSLSLKTIQSVRPFRHDEYPRFIKTAFPYYLSSMIMLGGVFILFVVLMFTK
jgi:oligosaccharyltransferase complex subunit beta